jgi:putative endonuclease
VDGYRRAALGGAGEAAAEAYLTGRGLRLVERDVRIGRGQIDLVMLDGDVLVVVEVKARRGRAFGLPEEAVHGLKQAQLRRLTNAYRALHPRVGRSMRVDVVAVDLGPDGKPVRCRHIVNALA